MIHPDEDQDYLNMSTGLGDQRPTGSDLPPTDYIRDAAHSDTVITLAEIPTTHPVSGFATIYEKNKRPDGWINRSAFDPVDHPKILPWIMIAEEIEGGFFKTRLMGTGAINLLGGDFTGRLFDDAADKDIWALRSREIELARSTGTPQYSKSLIEPDYGPAWTAYRGVFPCLHGDKELFFFVLAPEKENI